MEYFICNIKKTFNFGFFIILCLTVFFPFNTFSQTSTLQFTKEEKVWISNHPIINVGNERYWPPMDFAIDGEAMGYSIDLMNLIAKELGIEINYVNGLSWSDLLEALNKGTIDVLPAISKTEEREAYMKFSKSYIKLPYVKVINEKLPDGEVNNLEYKTIAVFKGSNVENALINEYPNAKLVYLKTVIEAIQRVSTGEVDIFIENLAVISYYMNESYFPNIKLNSNNLNFLKSPDVFIGVLKKNKILGDLIEKGLDAVSREDLINLRNKWLPVETQKSETSKTEELLTYEERQWVSHQPTLMVANEMDLPPFNFSDNGIPKGYSVELIKLISKKLDLPIDFVDGNTWAEIIEKFKLGELDILPFVHYTEERNEFMSFTKSYESNHSVLAVNEQNTTLKTLDDPAFKKVAVISDYATTEILKNKYPNIEQVFVDNITEALTEVSLGNADGFVGTLGTLTYILDQNFIPNIKIVGVVKLKTKEEIQIHIAVAKDSIFFRNILQKGLDAVTNEEINQMRRNWIRVNDKPEENFQPEDLLTDEEKQWISNQTPIKVANSIDWAPFNFSEKGTPKGYSIELLQLVGKKTGLPLEFISGNTWEEILELFKIGELDILPSAYFTESRDEFISFTESYASNPSVIVVNAQNSDIKTLEDLLFKKVAVVSNFATAEILDSRYPDIEQIYVNNVGEGLNAVSLGNVDAFIASLGTVSYAIDKKFIPNVKIIGNISIKRTEETQLHFGVAKDKLILRDILQKGLDAVSGDEIKNIRQKWMPVEISQNKEAGFFKSSDLWKVIITIILLFIAFYFGFKWVFKKFIKEKVALEFGSRKFRIQTNFYLTVLVIVIAAMGWLSITYIEGEFNDNIKLQLENDLNSANGRLEFWLKERKDYLKSLGHDQKLIDLTSELKEVTRSNDKKQYNFIHDKMAQFFEEHHYQGDFIINEEGINIGSIDTSLVGNLNSIAKYKPELIKSVFAGDVVFVPPLLTIDDKLDNIQNGDSSSMYFLIPIEDTEHHVIAAIIHKIDPELGFSEILQLSHVGETGESYIFNRKGRMLSISRFEKELKTMGVFQLSDSGIPYIEIKDPGGNLTTGFKTEVPINKRSLTLMASSAVEGNNGVNVEGYNDYRGVPVMGAWTWIDKLELGLATEIDVDEALDLFYFIRLAAIIVLGLTLLIIIGSILFTLTLGEKANKALLKAKRELEKRVEERTSELENERTFLNTLMNSIPDFIFYKDINNNYLGANDPFLNQIGKEINDLKGKSDFDLLTLKKAKEFKKIDTEIIKSLKPFTSETEEKDAEGNNLIFETRKTPFFNKKGDLLGLIGISRDITERKKAELRVKSQSAALKSTANGVVITNTKGEIVWVNPAFRKLTGYSWDELIGENPRLFNSGKHDKAFYEEMWNTITSGKTWHGEIINKKKDGALFHEEMTITPILDNNNKITQFVAIKNDITERKKAEEEIRASENRFRSITSTATDAIVSADKKGVIESWNDAAEKIFGYTEKEAIGQKLEIIIPNKYHKSHQIGIKRVLGGGEKKAIGRIVELEGQHKNGNLFPIELALSIFQGKGGTNFSAIIRDITERKELEKILLKAKQRMEDELNVAKDIQMSMLPLIFPAFPKREEINIYAELIPAREVGGDFYDFYFLDENHLCFVMADVSGKGVPAALMMAVTKTLLKSRASNDKSTASILTDVNNEIAKDNDSYMFITVFMAILNTNTGELVYSNAGHNPSYIISKENKKLNKLGDLHGPVIGAMEGMAYGETSLFVKKNDIIFSYTDGVTESHNIKAELYSDPRLEELLENGNYDSSKTLTKLVIQSVNEFAGEADQFDDITVMAIEYFQNPKTVSSIKSTIEIKNDLKQIATAIEWFEAFALENKMPFAIIQKINIAFDELLNNIISYGFDDKEEHEIEIAIELRVERFIIIISDDGIPFNPFKKDPPDTMLTVEERIIGGLGIHLVKKLMDEYEYKRQTNNNIITLIKNNINT